jgi:RraA family protein
MSFATADLCDSHEDQLALGTLRVLEPLFHLFSRPECFSGAAVTLKVFEDNALVRAALEEKGEGRVLVIDGGGSLRCALLGANLAQLAQQNGWAGIVVNGCVRDTLELNDADVGVAALTTCPRRAAAVARRARASRRMDLRGSRRRARGEHGAGLKRRPIPDFDRSHSSLIQGEQTTMQTVFVYGTLRAGEVNDIRDAAVRNDIAEPTLLGTATVRGHLFDFGSYPGLVVDEAGVDVIGDVYEIDDALVAVLDEIEAVYPGVEDRFLAREVMLKIDGSVLNCRFYPVTPNAVKGLPEIRSGDWVGYRSTR